jgi:DNA-binding transcriptional ArsR family regulator
MAAEISPAPDSPEALDDLFHALSDRTRRAILTRLAERPTTVGDLAEPFAMSLPAVSKHVRVLERAGLLTRSVDGRLHRCSLDPNALRTADAWLAPYRTFWAEQFSALGRHLVQESGARADSRRSVRPPPPRRR